MTTGTAIGCVTQLNRQHRSADDPAARAIRTALIDQLTGQPRNTTTPAEAARVLLNDLPRQSTAFTPAESALLGQWLLVIADEDRFPPSQGARP